MKKGIIFLTVGILSGAMNLCARPPQELKFDPLKFSPPQVLKRVFGNGTTVFLLPDHELPLIQITAFIKTGTMYDSVDKAGVASLCGNLMRSGGTKNMKADEIDEELEFLGASVETGMDQEAGSASLSVLKKDLDQGLKILAEVLMFPVFDNKKLEIEKAKLIEGIRRRNDEPYQIARREFRKLLYGESHPLSRTVEIPIVKKISRKDLIAFHSRYFYPNNMTLAVSGDFEVEEIMEKIQSLFKNWDTATISFPDVIRMDPPVTFETFKSSSSARMVGYAEKPLNQTSIIIGHLGVKRHNPDRFALEVMNEILGGGGFTSRLYKEVRSRLGLAYWVGSSFTEPWDYGTIAAGLQTKSDSTYRAIQSVLKEMEKIREKEVPEEELKMAKDSIINSFVFRYASSHAVVSQKMSLEYFGYPEDYLETYTQKISQVTAQEVIRVAKKYLHPELLTFLIVGNQKDFDQPVSEFGQIHPINLKILE